MNKMPKFIRPDELCSDSTLGSNLAEDLCEEDDPMMPKVDDVAPLAKAYEALNSRAKAYVHEHFRRAVLQQFVFSCNVLEDIGLASMESCPH